MVTAALSPGFGYGIILGLGAAFGKHINVQKLKKGANMPTSYWNGLYHLGSQKI